jgi:hypothetical protein
MYPEALAVSEQGRSVGAVARVVSATKGIKKEVVAVAANVNNPDVAGHKVGPANVRAHAVLGVDLAAEIRPPSAVSLSIHCDEDLSEASRRVIVQLSIKGLADFWRRRYAAPHLFGGNRVRKNNTGKQQSVDHD